LVTLTIDNTGRGGLINLRDIEITINNTGFQSISEIPVTRRSGGFVFRSHGDTSYLQDQKLSQIRVEQDRLDWDEQIEIEYTLVPILFREFDDYAIASSITVSYRYDGKHYSQQFADLGWSSSTEVDNAFRGCRLPHHYNPCSSISVQFKSR